MIEQRKPISRREFLKDVVRVGGLFSVAALLGACIPQKAPTAEEVASAIMTAQARNTQDAVVQATLTAYHAQPARTPQPGCEPTQCPARQLTPVAVNILTPGVEGKFVPCTAYTEASYPERPNTINGFKVQFGGGENNRQIAHLWMKTMGSDGKVAYGLEDYILVPLKVKQQDFEGAHGYMGEITDFPRTCDWKNLAAEAILGVNEKGPDHATGRVWTYDQWMEAQKGNANAKPLVTNAFQFKGQTYDQIAAKVADPTK